MAADEMYFYLDDTAQQKGPLPRRALLKLLESGLVSRATYVWRHGADAGAGQHAGEGVEGGAPSLLEGARGR